MDKRITLPRATGRKWEMAGLELKAQKASEAAAEDKNAEYVYYAIGRADRRARARRLRKAEKRKAS